MKCFVAGVLILAVLSVLPGCVTQYDSAMKLRDLEFTVTDEEDAPEELRTMIDEAREDPYRLIFAEQGLLWIAEGYGRKETTGYSVEVRELYETEDAVHIRTRLLGPGAQEEIRGAPTYPCVIVQMEYIEKDVLFD